MIQYFYIEEGVKKGPVTKEALQNLNLSSTSLVWKQGLSNWTKAGEVEELKDVIITNPPPTPKENIANRNKVIKGSLGTILNSLYFGVIGGIIIVVICLLIYNPWRFDGEKYKNITGTSTYSSDWTKAVYYPSWWADGFYDYLGGEVAFNSLMPQTSYQLRKEYLISKAIKNSIITVIIISALHMVWINRKKLKGL